MRQEFYGIRLAAAVVRCVQRRTSAFRRAAQGRPLNVASALVVFIFVSSAMAVSTSHWIQSSEKDWRAGKFKNVVVTNLGDVKLSRQVQTLLEEDSRISSVYCMAETPDGTIYAGTGPQGVLLSIKGDKIATAATLERDESIFSLAINKNGRLLMGTGGEKGRIIELEKGGEVREIFSQEGVQYVWAMAVTPDGNIYAGTGPSGQLVEIRSNGSHSVILESHENNLLSLLSDGKDTLYVGSDPDGRVYRVNRKTKESFVLYEADESEISALTLDAQGNLYAATGEADQAAPNGQPEAAPETGGEGRPEAAPGGIQIPSTPPANPTPPQLPEPNPGEPQPIPKSSGNSEIRKISFELIANNDAPPAAAPAPPPSPEKPEEPKKSAPANKSSKTVEPGPAENVGNAVAPGAKGNAIYRIDPQGFVTEVFRQPVIVLSMIQQNGKLLVGTGDDGTVYEVDPVAEETLALTKVEAKDVMCLFPATDGRTFMGLANVGGIAAMPARLAGDATYTSAVLDATQISRFGKMQMRGLLPAGTTLKVSTHTGNIETPDDSTWSKWTDPEPATQYFQIQSPNARFLQYRLFFTSDKTGKQTPIVRHIDVAYRLPNLAPQIKAVRITAAGKPADNQGGDNADNQAADKTPPGPGYKTGRGTVTIQWEASDPNSDSLIYTIYYRTGPFAPWILIKDKLTDPQLDWDTRNVPDGQYTIKVVASDALANPVGQGKNASRISDPVAVDNTPPVIGDISWQKQASGAKLKLRAVDASSEISSVDYSVDSNADWQAASSSDSIFDSPAESVELNVTGLKPGEHQVSIRATDDHGNQGYQSVMISVDAP